VYPRVEKHEGFALASPHSTCTLVVANLTASTPKLLEEVHRRDLAGSRQFLLLIPTVPERTHPDWTPEVALRLLKRAAPSAQVQNMSPGTDAMATLERAIQRHHVDEIIVSTLRNRLGGWTRRDLSHRVNRLGVPVTVVQPEVDRADAERFREHVERLGVIALSGLGFGR
jgi:hypothetical protein